jgi:hypothetical protein
METVNATVITWAHGKASIDDYSHIAAKFAVEALGGKRWLAKKKQIKDIVRREEKKRARKQRVGGKRMWKKERNENGKG